jgi:hypothetical protein
MHTIDKFSDWYCPNTITDIVQLNPIGAPYSTSVRTTPCSVVTTSAEEEQLMEVCSKPNQCKLFTLLSVQWKAPMLSRKYCPYQWLLQLGFAYQPAITFQDNFL